MAYKQSIIQSEPTLRVCLRKVMMSCCVSSDPVSFLIKPGHRWGASEVHLLEHGFESCSGVRTMPFPYLTQCFLSTSTTEVK